MPTGQNRPTDTSVLLIEPDMGRSAMLKRALVEAGYAVLASIGSAERLRERVEALAPDIIIIALDSPDRDTLDSLQAVSLHRPKPVVMFAADGDSNTIDKAIRAGVSAYVVDGLDSKRLRPVLEVAIARFREYQALREELQATRNKLAERKVIERAKGILMKQRGVDEEEAYRLLRRAAMDAGQRLGDLARSLVRAAELLG